MEKETKSNNSSLNELFLYAIKHFSIEEYITDWADDDTDWGRGYCYNNSYGWTRAPKMYELVVQDGALSGFSVGHEDEVLEINGKHDIRYVKRYDSGNDIEDERGYASGEVRCKFELTEYAVEHPIEAINWLGKFFDNRVTMLKR